MSLGGGGGGQLEELQQQLQLLEQQKQAIRAEIQSVRAQQGMIDDAIDAVETLESDSTVQVPLGGGAYVRAEIQDIDEIVVELGGGYAAERDSDGAISSLENKRGALDDRIEDLEGEITEIESDTEALEAKAQQLQQQQMQQLQQQMGQGQDE